MSPNPINLSEHKAVSKKRAIQEEERTFFFEHNRALRMRFHRSNFIHRCRTLTKWGSRKCICIIMAGIVTLLSLLCLALYWGISLFALLLPFKEDMMHFTTFADAFTLTRVRTYTWSSINADDNSNTAPKSAWCNVRTVNDQPYYPIFRWNITHFKSATSTLNSPMTCELPFWSDDVGCTTAYNTLITPSTRASYYFDSWLSSSDNRILSRVFDYTFHVDGVGGSSGVNQLSAVVDLTGGYTWSRFINSSIGFLCNSTAFTDSVEGDTTGVVETKNSTRTNSGGSLNINQMVTGKVRLTGSRVFHTYATSDGIRFLMATTIVSNLTATVAPTGNTISQYQRGRMVVTVTITGDSINAGYVWLQATATTVAPLIFRFERLGLVTPERCSYDSPSVVTCYFARDRRFIRHNFETVTVSVNEDHVQNAKYVWNGQTANVDIGTFLVTYVGSGTIAQTATKTVTLCLSFSDSASRPVIRYVTPTATTTSTGSASASASLSFTATATLSVSVSRTESKSDATRSRSLTVKRTRSISMSSTILVTPTKSAVASPTRSAVLSRSSSRSISDGTRTESVTLKVTATRSRLMSPSRSRQLSPSTSSTQTASRSVAPPRTMTLTPFWTETKTAFPSQSLAVSSTLAKIFTATASDSSSSTPSLSVSSSTSQSLTVSDSLHVPRTATFVLTETESNVKTPSGSVASTPSLSIANSVSRSRTFSDSSNITRSATPQVTNTGSFAQTPSDSLASTPSLSVNNSASRSVTVSGSLSETLSNGPLATSTRSLLASPSASDLLSASSTISVSKSQMVLRSFSTNETHSKTMALTGTLIPVATVTANPTASLSLEIPKTNTSEKSVTRQPTLTLNPTLSVVLTRNTLSSGQSVTVTVPLSSSKTHALTNSQRITETHSAIASETLSSTASDKSWSASASNSLNPPITATQTASASLSVSGTVSSLMTPLYILVSATDTDESYYRNAFTTVLLTIAAPSLPFYRWRPMDKAAADKIIIDGRRKLPSVANPDNTTQVISPEFISEMISNSTLFESVCHIVSIATLECIIGQSDADLTRDEEIYVAVGGEHIISPTYWKGRNASQVVGKFMIQNENPPEVPPFFSVINVMSSAVVIATLVVGGPWVEFQCLLLMLRSSCATWHDQQATKIAMYFVAPLGEAMESAEWAVIGNVLIVLIVALVQSAVNSLIWIFSFRRYELSRQYRSWWFNIFPSTMFSVGTLLYPGVCYWTLCLVLSAGKEAAKALEVNYSSEVVFGSPAVAIIVGLVWMVALPVALSAAARFLLPTRLVWVRYVTVYWRDNADAPVQRFITYEGHSMEMLKQSMQPVVEYGSRKEQAAKLLETMNGKQRGRRNKQQRRFSEFSSASSSASENEGKNASDSSEEDRKAVVKARKRINERKVRATAEMFAEYERGGRERSSLFGTTGVFGGFFYGNGTQRKKKVSLFTDKAITDEPEKNKNARRSVAPSSKAPSSTAPISRVEVGLSMGDDDEDEYSDPQGGEVRAAPALSGFTMADSEVSANARENNEEADEDADAAPLEQSPASAEKPAHLQPVMVDGSDSQLQSSFSTRRNPFANALRRKSSLSIVEQIDHNEHSARMRSGFELPSGKKRAAANGSGNGSAGGSPPLVSAAPKLPRRQSRFAQPNHMPMAEDDFEAVEEQSPNEQEQHAAIALPSAEGDGNDNNESLQRRRSSYQLSRGTTLAATMPRRASSSSPQARVGTAQGGGGRRGEKRMLPPPGLLVDRGGDGAAAPNAAMMATTGQVDFENIQHNDTVIKRIQYESTAICHESSKVDGSFFKIMVPRGFYAPRARNTFSQSNLFPHRKYMVVLPHVFVFLVSLFLASQCALKTSADDYVSGGKFVTDNISAPSGVCLASFAGVAVIFILAAILVAASRPYRTDFTLGMSVAIYVCGSIVALLAAVGTTFNIRLAFLFITFIMLLIRSIHFVVLKFWEQKEPLLVDVEDRRNVGVDDDLSRNRRNQKIVLAEEAVHDAESSTDSEAAAANAKRVVRAEEEHLSGPSSESADEAGQTKEMQSPIGGLNTKEEISPEEMQRRRECEERRVREEVEKQAAADALAAKKREKAELNRQLKEWKAAHEHIHGYKPKVAEIKKDPIVGEIFARYQALKAELDGGVGEEEDAGDADDGVAAVEFGEDVGVAATANEAFQSKLLGYQFSAPNVDSISDNGGAGLNPDLNNNNDHNNIDHHNLSKATNSDNGQSNGNSDEFHTQPQMYLAHPAENLGEAAAFFKRILGTSAAPSTVPSGTGAVEELSPPLPPLHLLPLDQIRAEKLAINKALKEWKEAFVAASGGKKPKESEIRNDPVMGPQYARYMLLKEREKLLEANPADDVGKEEIPFHLLNAAETTRFLLSQNAVDAVKNNNQADVKASADCVAKDDPMMAVPLAAPVIEEATADDVQDTAGVTFAGATTVAAASDIADVNNGQATKNVLPDDVGNRGDPVVRDDAQNAEFKSAEKKEDSLTIEEMHAEKLAINKALKEWKEAFVASSGGKKPKESEINNDPVMGPQYARYQILKDLIDLKEKGVDPATSPPTAKVCGPLAPLATAAPDLSAEHPFTREILPPASPLPPAAANGTGVTPSPAPHSPEPPSTHQSQIAAEEAAAPTIASVHVQKEQAAEAKTKDAAPPSLANAGYLLAAALPDDLTLDDVVAQKAAINAELKEWKEAFVAREGRKPKESEIKADIFMGPQYARYELLKDRERTLLASLNEGVGGGATAVESVVAPASTATTTAEAVSAPTLPQTTDRVEETNGPPTTQLIPAREEAVLTLAESEEMAQLNATLKAWKKAFAAQAGRNPKESDIKLDSTVAPLYARVVSLKAKRDGTRNDDNAKTALVEATTALPSSPASIKPPATPTVDVNNLFAFPPVMPVSAARRASMREESGALMSPAEEKAAINKQLKVWKQSFTELNGRNPKESDILADPTVGDLYRRYQTLKNSPAVNEMSSPSPADAATPERVEKDSGHSPVAHSPAVNRRKELTRILKEWKHQFAMQHPSGKHATQRDIDAVPEMAALFAELKQLKDSDGSSPPAMSPPLPPQRTDIDSHEHFAPHQDPTHASGDVESPTPPMLVSPEAFAAMSKKEQRHYSKSIADAIKHFKAAFIANSGGKKPKESDLLNDAVFSSVFLEYKRIKHLEDGSPSGKGDGDADQHNQAEEVGGAPLSASNADAANKRERQREEELANAWITPSALRTMPPSTASPPTEANANGTAAISSDMARGPAPTANASTAASQPASVQAKWMSMFGGSDTTGGTQKQAEKPRNKDDDDMF